MRRAAQLGTNLYIQKPVEFDEFLKVARRIMDLVNALKPGR
jgi:hypothetical protein